MLAKLLWNSNALFDVRKQIWWCETAHCFLKDNIYSTHLVFGVRYPILAEFVFASLKIDIGWLVSTALGPSSSVYNILKQKKPIKRNVTENKNGWAFRHLPVNVDKFLLRVWNPSPHQRNVSRSKRSCVKDNLEIVLVWKETFTFTYTIHDRYWDNNVMPQLSNM